MEKAATYTVMAPPHPCKRQWAVWAAVGVSVVALVVACVTAAVVNEQAGRINHLEGRLMEMESHIEDILRLTIASQEYDYQDYDDDYIYEDDQVDGQEGLTVRRVVRRRRQVSTENELPDSSVPIYDRAYGIDLKTQAAPKGLRLYDSLLDNEDTEDQSSSEDTPEATESPIKPYHRVSSMWIPPKRRRPRLPSSGTPTLSSRTVVRQVDSTNGDAQELPDSIFPSGPSALLRSRLTQSSNTKSLHGPRRGTKRQQKQRVRSNKAPTSVVFRPSFVKATSRHDGFSSRNSVVPQVPDTLDQLPKVVEQDGERTTPVAFARPPTTSRFYGKKRRKLRNKQHRRRRRARPLITLAHFGASSVNATSHSYHGAGEHLEWTPANWMDKLGLNSKYTLDQGTVTVKEPGLYYLYAQVLYESGRSGAGYQILVDDIPILECQLPALRPAPTCLTGGLSYLPRNAKVRVRDLMTNLVTVRRHQNTFFGLVKLMDARYTAEEMLLA